MLVAMKLTMDPVERRFWEQVQALPDAQLLEDRGKQHIWMHWYREMLDVACALRGIHD